MHWTHVSKLDLHWGVFNIFRSLPQLWGTTPEHQPWGRLHKHPPQQRDPTLSAPHPVLGPREPPKKSPRPPPQRESPWQRCRRGSKPMNQLVPCERRWPSARLREKMLKMPGSKDQVVPTYLKGGISHPKIKMTLNIRCHGLRGHWTPWEQLKSEPALFFVINGRSSLQDCDHTRILIESTGFTWFQWSSWW